MALRTHACTPSHLSCVQLCVIQWTVTCQAPLSMRFSRQESWSGLLPCLPPGDLLNPGTEPGSHVSWMGTQVLYQYLGSLEPKLRVIQVDFKKFMFSQGEKSRLLATLTSLQKKNSLIYTCFPVNIIISLSLNLSLNYLAWINVCWVSPKGGWYLCQTYLPVLLPFQLHLIMSTEY